MSKKIDLVEFVEDGKRMMQVSIGDNLFATVEADDYNKLRDLGLLTRWRVHSPSGHIIATCKTADAGYVLVGRVISGASEHEACRYRDMNPKNLRKDNLYTVYDPRKGYTDARKSVLSSSTAKPN